MYVSEERRKFRPRFQGEAVQMVIVRGKPVAEVARDLTRVSAHLGSEDPSEDVEETSDPTPAGTVPHPRTDGGEAAPRRRSALASVLVDQGISSLTNFVVVLYAMHTLSLAEFGAFSIVVGCYIVAFAAVRGLCVEVLLSSYAGATEAELRVNARRAVGATALL